jgi:hypothetical protein
MGLSFTIAASPRQRILSSESQKTHDHILLSQTGDSPNIEGQVPVFMYLRYRVTLLYPQALNSRFVAFYDSQGYGGGVRTRLHTGSRYRVFLSSGRIGFPDREQNVSRKLMARRPVTEPGDLLLRERPCRNHTPISTAATLTLTV